MSFGEMKNTLQFKGNNADMIESIIKAPIGILDDVNRISNKNFEDIFKGNKQQEDNTAQIIDNQFT